MRLNLQAQAMVLAAAAIMMFAIGAGAAACVSAPRNKASPAMGGPQSTAADLVVEYALAHPDKAISGPFADKLKRGEIKIAVEKPREHAMASFGQHEGAYRLTIDPVWLKREPTKDELEDVFSILTHEHAHYRQFVEGQMTNYHPQKRPMTETQCTLVILVEIDAHAKACRDAKRYGWTSEVASGACARTNATLAEYFLRERAANYPECKGVWDHFATHEPKKPVAKAKMSSAPPKRRSGDPVYLPPP